MQAGNWCVQKPLAGDTVIILQTKKKVSVTEHRMSWGVARDVRSHETAGRVYFFNPGNSDEFTFRWHWPHLACIVCSMVNVPCKSVILLLSADPDS